MPKTACSERSENIYQMIEREINREYFLFSMLSSTAFAQVLIISFGLFSIYHNTVVYAYSSIKTGNKNKEENKSYIIHHPKLTFWFIFF